MFKRIITLNELPPRRLLEAIEKIENVQSVRHANELFNITREMFEERTSFLKIPTIPVIHNIAILKFGVSEEKPYSFLTYSWGWTSDTVKYYYGEIKENHFNNQVFAGRIRGRGFRNLCNRPAIDLATSYEQGMIWRLDPTIIIIQQGKDRKTYDLKP